MRRRVRPGGVSALVLVLCGAWLAAPARADTATPGTPRRALTTVSAATLKALGAAPVKPAPAAAARRQQAAPAAGGFFKSGKGAVAIGLMAAGAAFTVWSINHDRKPVKSPVR